MGKIIEFKNPMDKYGVAKTNEWYQRHVEKLCRGEINATLYGIATYDGEIWFPYEVGRDGAPIDCAPYAPFNTEEKAMECIKRLGGVYIEDYEDVRDKLRAQKKIAQ